MPISGLLVTPPLLLVLTYEDWYLHFRMVDLCCKEPKTECSIACFTDVTSVYILKTWSAFRYKS